MPPFSDHSYLVGLLIMVHEDEVDGEEWHFIKLECCQMHHFAFIDVGKQRKSQNISYLWPVIFGNFHLKKVKLLHTYIKSERR